jgi:hypothetical protein
MNLPLFPDPVPPESTPPPRPRPSTALPASREPQRVSENASVLASSPPLSIRDIAALIHDRMRPLTVLGPRIVHAQWLRPGINAGSRGFLSVNHKSARCSADDRYYSGHANGFIRLNGGKRKACAALFCLQRRGHSTRGNEAHHERFEWSTDRIKPWAGYLDSRTSGRTVQGGRPHRSRCHTGGAREIHSPKEIGT